VSQGVKYTTKNGTYLVVGPLCWGYADTLDEATKRCRLNRPKAGFVKSIEYRSFYFEPGVTFEVNGIDGTVTWDKAESGRRIRG
jgi:hypothetical protein